MIRMDKMQGRADAAVKIRGINVFSEAVGEIIAKDPRTTKEYFCIVDYAGAAKHEEMTVLVEYRDESVDKEQLNKDLSENLKMGLGVRVNVELVAPGQVAKHTGIEDSTKKVKRLLDKRKA
jgi:phenylacetate-CoA ligase